MAADRTFACMRNSQQTVPSAESNHRKVFFCRRLDLLLVIFIEHGGVDAHASLLLLFFMAKSIRWPLPMSAFISHTTVGLARSMSTPTLMTLRCYS